MRILSVILFIFACTLVLATFVAIGLLIFGKILQYQAKNKHKKKGRKKR